MADVTINRRKVKRKIFSPAFNSRPSQVERTNQSVTTSGASVAIRPKRTSVRRLDTRGTGTVAYY